MYGLESSTHNLRSFEIYSFSRFTQWVRSHSQIWPNPRDIKLQIICRNSDSVDAGTFSGFHRAPMQNV